MGNPRTTRYSFIFKVTALFSGVEVFKILIAIIRSKVIALLLGPEGFGIINMFLSSTAIIQKITNSGLNISAVRDITLAGKSENIVKLSRIVIVFRRLIFFTGLAGVLATIVLAPKLSNLVFNNDEYTTAFGWISITVLLNQLSSGQITILQGLAMLRKLALASLWGSTCGVLASLPFYYYYGYAAIIPTIIISSIIALIVSWWYSRKIPVKKIKVSLRRTLIVGRDMIILGFFLNLTSFYTMAVSYLLKIYISNIGSLELLGLYAAAMAILTRYVGMIFTAMSREYYPRLTSVAHDPEQSRITVNQQIEVTLLLLAPLIIIFLLFTEQFVVLLYSIEFLGVEKLLKLASIGMILRGASWPIGYLYIAKGDKKLFTVSNLIFYSIALLLDVIAFKLYGLTGLGISFLLSSVFSLLFSLGIGWHYYKYALSSEAFKIIMISLLLSSGCMVAEMILYEDIKIITSLIILSGIMSYYFVQINKRVDFKKMLKKFNKAG